jgi:trans-aconitate 2-methyltransferase
VADWNPDQYERFRAQRSQPFHDLLGLLQAAPRPRVLDLGCGTGELTRVLHERIVASATLGIDSSEAMLAKAARQECAGLRFVKGDIGRAPDEHPGPWDVVFSNAALHWLPDLREAVRALTPLLAPGGQLAVQVPMNFDHASHVTAAEIAREAPFAAELGGYTRPALVYPPEELAELLYALGYVEQRVRLEIYAHELPRRADVVEWVKGTLLVDYEQRLRPESFAAFMARYVERLLPRLGAVDPYLYPFKRLLFWGRRPPGSP